MATQTRYPQSNQALSGYTGWANPENCYAADDVLATAVVSTTGYRWQQFYNFGFNIPAGATINSVTMEFRAKGTDNGASNSFLRLAAYKNTTLSGAYINISTVPTTLTIYSASTTGTWTVEELNDNSLANGPSLQLYYRIPEWAWNGTGYCDYVRITVDYTEPNPPIEYEGGAAFPFSGAGTYTILGVQHPDRTGVLRLWSPDRAYLWAETTNYRSLQITRRFVGNSLLEAYFFKGSDEEYYIPKGGWIEDDEGEWYRIEYRLAGKDTVHVIAYSPHMMLKQRITVPESEAYAIEATGTADEVVKAIIDAAVRGLPITTAADRTTGASISEVSRYKNLADEVRRICESNGLGESFVKTLEGFEFDTYPGTDRTRGNTDGNAPAIFSVRYDNLEDWSHSISAVDEVTTVYVAGQGEGALRTIVIVGGATTGEDRREAFRDARDSDDTDVLTERGNQTLMPALEALSAKANTSSNLIYNEDYQLGDLVTVEIPERSIELVEGVWTPFDRYTSADKRITEVVRTYQDGRFDVDLVFGDAPLTRADKTAALKSDLARLEAI